MPDTTDKRLYSKIPATDDQLRAAYMDTYLKYQVKGIAIQHPETVPLFSGVKYVSVNKGRPVGSKNKVKAL